MMKFKHLFNNRDLTFMLLNNWDYNNDKFECLNDFRISSNAVYPVYIGGVKCFLRFAPTDEKVISHVKVELEFLKYLHKMKYRSFETVPTKVVGNLLFPTLRGVIIYDEFTFRFNRRNLNSRGMLFYRLLQNAVQLHPITYTDIVNAK
jgi:hypothetical protein